MLAIPGQVPAVVVSAHLFIATGTRWLALFRALACGAAEGGGD